MRTAKTRPSPSSSRSSYSSTAGGLEPPLPDLDPVVQLPDNWLEWTEVWSDPAPTYFGPGSEWSEMRWVAVADADLVSESGSLRYFRIKTTSLAVVRAVVSTDEKLVDVCEGNCPNAGGPPPREGFLTAASAARKQLWIAGGDGRHDVWQYDLETGAWLRLADDGALGTMLALTYDGVNDRLLVLARRGTELDLWELGWDGSHTIVTSWTGVERMTTFGLSADARGGAWLTSSDGGAYCVVRFEPVEDTLEVTGGVEDYGYLPANGSVAGNLGLSALVLDSQTGAYGIRGFDPAALQPPGSWIFEECM